MESATTSSSSGSTTDERLGSEGIIELTEYPAITADRAAFGEVSIFIICIL